MLSQRWKPLSIAGTSKAVSHDRPFAGKRRPGSPAPIRRRAGSGHRLGSPVARCLLGSRLRAEVGMMAGMNDRELGPPGDAAPGELVDAGAAAALERLRALMAREKEACERAEAQQIRLAEDFQIAYRRAAELAARLERAYWGTIGALARAIEAR